MRPESSPFHEGECVMQAQSGVRDQAESAGRRMIRDHMPDQHRHLFAELPTLMLGTLDAQGRPWASLLVGEPGFVSSPDATTLAIATLPAPADPARAHLRVGAPIAVLGLQHHTRRRNRANGEVAAMDEHGLVVRVRQSFGNCPQYIEPRRVEPKRSGKPTSRIEESGGRLSARAVERVRASDTFFIASAGRGGSMQEGVDVSHRGGPPGFVTVTEHQGRTVLEWPDYRGNYMFNTLGNLLVNPRAGLLFVDYLGDAWLSLTGRTEISGTEEEGRSIRFVLDEAVHVEGVGLAT